MGGKPPLGNDRFWPISALGEQAEIGQKWTEPQMDK